MHDNLKQLIRNQIITATDFTCGHMPVDLPEEQIYEDLFGGIVGGEIILRAFRAAGRHLQPASLIKRASVVANGQMIVCNLRLASTDKDNHYFVPIAGFAITPESKLARALTLPLQVARQWAMLRQAFDRLADVADTMQIAMLMPWLRDMVDERTIEQLCLRKIEQRKVERDVKVITCGDVPNRFPRLTSELNKVCLSGKALFTQYRLLTDASNEGKLTVPPIAVMQTESLLPKWFVAHMIEVLGDWVEGK